jgi:hypothetical protein
MTKASSLLLLIVTLSPIFYFLFFIFHVVFVPVGTAPTGLFAGILDLHMVFAIWTLLLTAFYVVLVLRTESVPREKRGLWCAVLVLGSVFAMPFFWYLYIWRPLTRSY